MSYSIINIYRMYHYLFIQLQTFANCSLEIVRYIPLNLVIKNNEVLRVWSMMWL